MTRRRSLTSLVSLFSSLNDKKHIFETLARFDSEQSELLDVVSSLENGREVVAPFTSVALSKARQQYDELLVKLSSNEEQLYVEERATKRARC